ncbi:carbohydrate ABC transporter permease [Rhodococcus sp. IEGM 1341]|uniref:carbohydrate ABC transporter permease n=1 Tax=Rhodococcus sp. IEGM 1341 TaxID=3047090 RepID=UPI0024B7F06C|nr:carbohydrate ABC transporter permease [Rhodococcus sp. IEGM 1341]MDI9927374.1 carbohydrate ABC transporter permease [Rhodococcus sp. IEGM 1341]
MILRTVRISAIVLACIVSIFPFYWMLRTSVASQDSVMMSGLSWLPDSFDLSNYSRAWTEANLGRAMLNGAAVTLGILALQLLTCVPAAYAFAKVPFRGRSTLFALTLACLLIPTQATALPLYLGIGSAGLANTLTALIIPFATSAFGIFLMRQHMLTIPDALLDAAKADGLRTLSTLWRVVVPSAMPAIATFSVFSIFVHWNDYLWPLLVARDAALHTPPLALAVFQQADTGFDYGALTAGAAIITTPIVILFLIAQRRFVAGIAGGELPG